MTPYEIMLSESQERMLLVADKGREREVQEIFAKWGLSAVVVGRVTDSGHLRLTLHGETVADIPNRFLADEAPRYNRPATPPPTGLPTRLNAAPPRSPFWKRFCPRATGKSNRNRSIFR